MDKSKFKKLALMGMAGGMMIASQSPLSAELLDHSQLMAQGGCGGSRPNYNPNYGGGNSCSSQNRPSMGGGNSCSSQNRPSNMGGSNSCSSQNRPSNPNGQYYYNEQNTSSNQGGGHGCNGSTASRGQRPNNNTNTAGCGAARRARNSNRYTADAQMEMQQQQDAMSMGAKQSDADFINQLNEESKALYRGLDAQGKAEAQKMAQSGDKNKAVKDAAEKQADRNHPAPKGYNSQPQRGY